MDTPKEQPLKAASPSGGLEGISPEIIAALAQSIGDVMHQKAKEESAAIRAKALASAYPAKGLPTPPEPDVMAGGKPADALAGGDTSMAAVQAGATLGNALVASPILRRSMHRLASRKFWVVITTLAGLLSQHVMDLKLLPFDTLAIAGLTAVWVIIQGMIDAKEGGNA